MKTVSALMRYLNFKENNLPANLEVRGCVYSTRFLNESAKPVGFCSMEVCEGRHLDISICLSAEELSGNGVFQNGEGNNNFLVVGNSFACNQADLIYTAFKQHIRQFSVFCYYGCEVMTWTPDVKCWRRVNYTAMVQELRPDVVFVMSRSLIAKSPFDTMKPIEEDKIFQDHMWRMSAFEKIVKKVYLLQALPSCIDSCSTEAQKFMNTGRPLRDIQEELIKRDDFFARQRIQEVGKRCRACEIIDYLPVLVNGNGHYLGYNPRTNLLYLDDHNHFTRFFVISGFLMAMILGKVEQLNVKSFCIFYYRRAKRILPLYYLAIGGILIALLSILPLTFRSSNIDSAREAIIFISNVKKADPNLEYKKMLENAGDLFTHTWSLCVELQWYFLVPLLCVIQRSTIKWEKTFFAAVACCSLVYYFTTDDMTSFYSVFSRIWQFCSGIIAHLLHTTNRFETTEAAQRREKKSLLDTGIFREEEKKPSWENILPHVSSFVFLLSVVGPFVPVKIPEDALRTCVTGFSAILIIVGEKHQNILLSNQAIVYIGDISYALYLFHWPVYVMTKFFAPQASFALVLGVLVSILLAVATHHCFEKFYLRWPPFAILILTSALSASCALLALQPHNVYDGNFRVEPVDYKKINPNDAAWNMSECGQCEDIAALK
ncbi:hypothetical protein Y032_0232g3026 [Ancylostoma ceylanicum]|nr:hypothetical protein Y032_0232g3026 [Ancylostoma ceylanicum]